MLRRVRFGVFLVCFFLIDRATKLFGSSSRNHSWSWQWPTNEHPSQYWIWSPSRCGCTLLPINSASDNGNDNNESKTTSAAPVEMTKMLRRMQLLSRTAVKMMNRKSNIVRQRPKVKNLDLFQQTTILHRNQHLDRRWEVRAKQRMRMKML